MKPPPKLVTTADAGPKWQPLLDSDAATGPAEEGDLRDRMRLDEVLAKHKPAAILHFAALIEVGGSVKDPVAGGWRQVVRLFVDMRDLWLAAERAARRHAPAAAD